MASRKYVILISAQLHDTSVNVQVFRSIIERLLVFVKTQFYTAKVCVCV